MLLCEYLTVLKFSSYNKNFETKLHIVFNTSRFIRNGCV